MKYVFGVDIGGTTVKLGLFDENGEWKLNSGNYNVFIGNAQPDKRSAELTGKKCEKISVKI